MSTVSESDIDRVRASDLERLDVADCCKLCCPVIVRVPEADVVLVL